ncbi:MAG TPA: hypothetical protein VLG50_00860 [Candidatus Saccharimonadales bacterium]|nr:hypothetical protein [Candidatus Saccharimonadales bacterium]
MKKLLTIALLFLARNCFTSQSSRPFVFQLEESIIQNVTFDTANYLCAQALNNGERSIARYIGKKFIGETWRNCQEYCAQIDTYERLGRLVPLELYTQAAPIVRAAIIEQAAIDLRIDVVRFISENLTS